MVDISEIFYRIKILPLVPRLLLFSLVGLLVVSLALWPFAGILFPASPVRVNAQPAATVEQPSNLNLALHVTPTITLQPTPTPIMASQPTPITVTQPTDTPQPAPTNTPTPIATAQLVPTDTPSPGITPTNTTQPTPQDAQALYTSTVAVPPAYTTSLIGQDGGKWDSGPFGGGGSCGFAGGGYQIGVPQKSFAGVCVASGTFISNFAYQVQMTITSGDGGGLVFRDSNQQMYRFRVGADGSYDLVNQNLLLATGSSKAIKTGLNQMNDLMVIAKDQQIYIYVNRQILMSVDDTASSSGMLGLFAVSLTHSTLVTFANVQVWRL